eukprot:jgi/Mesvir1/15215/Mv06445-RA.1
MGIQGLTKLLADNAPGCMREQKFDSYFGRKVAIDASMHMYQFLMMVGRVGDQLLTDADGEVTSHIQGMWNRTIRLLEAGIKPVYVFDGKPPEMKRHELKKRSARREDANAELAAAQEEGTTEDVAKFSKRTVKVTPQHNAECQKLLQLMGIPFLVAPSEAEAQCSQLCKEGKVYGTASEDMDALMFGTPRLIRHLLTPSSRNLPIMEIDLAKVLGGLKLTPDELIDLGILSGCDYCENIKGIGPTTALKLVSQHHSIEGVLEHIDTKKYNVPEDWPYKQARELFQKPDVLKGDDVPPFKWSDPDVEGLMKFLVTEKNFNEDRVKTAIEKIKKSKSKSSQGRLESFFGQPTVTQSSTKRKEPEPAKGKGKGGKPGPPKKK